MSNVARFAQPVNVAWRGNGTAPLTWTVADDADQAFAWGHTDATDGEPRDSSLYPQMNAAYFAYQQGYNAGLKKLVELGETVSQGQLDEAAWFDEICGAATMPVMRLTNAQLDEIERERVGVDFCEHPDLY